MNSITRTRSTFRSAVVVVALAAPLVIGFPAGSQARLDEPAHLMPTVETGETLRAPARPGPDGQQRATRSHDPAQDWLPRR